MIAFILRHIAAGFSSAWIWTCAQAVCYA